MNKAAVLSITVVMAVTVAAQPALALGAQVQSLTATTITYEAEAMDDMATFSVSLPDSAKKSGEVSISAVTSFKDLPKTHWAYNDVMEAVRNGYVVGYADGTFRPNAEVTRAEFAAIIARASKLVADNEVTTFRDVPSNNWSYSAINTAVAKGFFTPKDYVGRLNPTGALSRGEIAMWLANGLMESNDKFKASYLNLIDTLLPFTETYGVGFSKADVGNIAMLVGTKVMSGMPDGSFQPRKTVTRAEVVSLLNRYLKAEGSEPMNHPWIAELSEVGRDGTNIRSTGGHYPNSKYGPDRVIGKDFTMQYSGAIYGTLKLHRIIVIDYDAIGTAKESIYAKMFAGTNKKDWLPKQLGVFTNFTATFTKKLDNSTVFSQTVFNVTGEPISSNTREQFNIQTRPNSFPYNGYKGLGDYFSAGSSRTIWTRVGASKTVGVSIDRNGAAGMVFKYNN